MFYLEMSRKLNLEPEIMPRTLRTAAPSVPCCFHGICDTCLASGKWPDAETNQRCLHALLNWQTAEPFRRDQLVTLAWSSNHRRRLRKKKNNKKNHRERRRARIQKLRAQSVPELGEAASRWLTRTHSDASVADTSQAALTITLPLTG